MARMLSGSRGVATESILISRRGVSVGCTPSSRRQGTCVTNSRLDQEACTPLLAHAGYGNNSEEKREKNQEGAESGGMLQEAESSAGEIAH